MMKLAIVIFTYSALIFLSGCLSTSNYNKASVLKFPTILNFQIGSTSQADLVNILGEPSNILQGDDYFVMNYNDPKSDFQKLSANVNKSDKKLLSLFWSPEEDELESSLDYAKKIFDKAHYEIKEDKNIPNHVVSSGILFYIDKKSGVTIRYDKTRDRVEAIALYDRETRIPTSTK